jgi:hypothetical protein
VAYAYANLQSSSAKGDVSRCLVWVGELVDAMVIGPQLASTAETLYLRVPVAAASTGWLTDFHLQFCIRITLNLSELKKWT